MEKIVFFHMNQLGDLLFSLPVLKAAKQETGAKIYSVVKPALAPLLISSGVADATIEKGVSFFRFVKIIKSEKFSKAVLFSESPSSLSAAFLAGISKRFGFNTASLNFLLTNKTARTGVPSLFNNKNLGAAFGLKNIQSDYTSIIKIPKENSERVREWFKNKNLDSKKVIAVSAGASKKRQSKRLDNGKWAEIIDALSAKGFSCVLSGAAFEKESMAELSLMCKNRPEIFAAENGILDSAAFLQEAALFAGIDSGAMHLAAAAGAKCVGVFGNTDPLQVGPMPLEKHSIVKKDNVADIKASEVISAILKNFEF
ncbi:glycosyltransferase family 9 protein [Endomicrobium proavitum]|uniref:Lipopolysaccharide heptosyltransferase II n=1 Tax=Endomicrobium proavitum TaxID=1408281 RepID=A0A0G3WGX3_9BACT|nr:glycosyltransferase family 9 protein [Endomicrobium proavitum]AKL97921.1 Lipopolysaccharide heptosyltransferase II [Endomicrobium proavitum]